jgi:hypothetical protein
MGYQQSLELKAAAFPYAALLFYGKIREYQTNRYKGFLEEASTRGTNSHIIL